jgi:16S rRNA processing protein RimM
MMKYLKVGIITTTHGLRGGIKVLPMTTSADRFNNLEWVYIEGSSQKWLIKDVKIRPKDVVLLLEGLDTIEKVEPLRGKYLLTDEHQRQKLEEDQYYVVDLIGMKVCLLDGEMIGSVVQVIPTGAHDIYVVKSIDGEKEWMIPAVKAFIKDIIMEESKILIEPIEGLLT